MNKIVLPCLLALCLAALALCVWPAGAPAQALAPAQADLSIAVSAAPSPIDAGAILTCTLVYSNAGPAAAENVLISDTLPAGVAYLGVVSEDPPLPGPWQEGQLLSWSAGALADGAQGRIVFTARVDPAWAATPLLQSAAIGSRTPDPDPADNATLASTPLRRRADLALLKTDSPDPVNAGGGINYTLWLDNNGPSSATAVRLTDTLPAGVWLRSASPGYSGGNPLVWNVSALPAGARRTITLSVMVDETFQGLARNEAAAGAVETDPQPANNSDSSTTTVRGRADLAVSKTASPNPVIAGQTLNYALSIANGGPLAATGVRVTDTLPAGVTFLSGSPGHSGANPVLWTLDALEAQSSRTLTATVRVEPTTRGVLTNRVTAYSNEFDPALTNNSVQGSAAVQPVADLSVLKTDSLDPVPPLGRLTYNITVSNAGPSAATGVRVTDTIPEGGNYVSGSPGKQGYNPIYWVVGNLAAGASRTYTFTMDLDSRAGSSLNNRVSAAANETDPNTVNNKYTEYTEVRATVDLSLTQSDSADPIAAGERLTYTLLARNNGPAIATGVVVTDTLPAGAIFYAATPGSTGTTTRLWNVGTLAVGASKTITLAVTVDPSFEGTLTNLAAIGGAVPETTPANNADEETTRAYASADLGLTKSDNPDPATIGGDLAYNLVVTNYGPSVALGVDVTDTLPAGVTFRSATPGHTGPNPLRWRIARLFPGASTTLTVTVRVDPEAVEPLANHASASGAATDPTPGNNSVSAQTGIQYRPAMTLLKSAPASAAVGDALVYSYTLRYDAAHADGSPVRDLALVDDVAGEAAYQSGDDGDALLEPGEAWLWSAAHTVAPDDPDPLLGAAVATGLDRDGDALTARASAQTELLFQPALAVAKTGPASARLGETIAYSVTVRNDSAAGDGSAIGQVAVADDRGVVGSPVKTGGDSDATLEVGEVWTYPVAYRPRVGDLDPLVNVARVTALDRDGDPLAAEDSHSLRLDLAPALVVAKTGPASAEVGQRVAYTCTLAHDTLYGDSTPIADLSVTDSVAGAMALTQMSGGDNDALLEVGETWTYTVDYTIRPDDPDPLVNTARAEGRDEDRDAVTGAAEHALDIRHTAALTLDKTGPAGAAFGQAVVYTITVGYDAAHSDGSAIHGVAVTDTLTAPPALAARKGGDSDDLLELGESWVYTATRTIADDDRDPLVNTARATAQDRDGDPLAAQDSHTVRLPGLLLGAVTEAGDPVCADSRAYYAVVLANAGAVPLTNVVIAADLPEHATLVGAESTFGYVVDGPRRVHWSIPTLDVGRQASYNVALLIGPAAAGSTLELCMSAQADQVRLATRCASTTIISCVTPLPDRKVKVRLPILLR